MELWDVYDSNRLKTGKLHERGIPMSQGDYHIVVHVWVKNADGKFLITKRSPNKEYALHWECTGGSALAGDSSLDAALREVQEETGLRLDRHKGKTVYTFKNDAGYMFHDVWLFAHDFSLAEIVLQEGETCDAMMATEAEIRALIAQGAFVPVEEYIETVFGGGQRMNEFVKTRGVDFTVSGETRVFKGVSFGSWMNIESFMIGLPGCDMQIYTALRMAYGPEKTAQFYEKYLSAYVGEADIQYLASLGVDLVRLPFSYRYFWDDNDIHAQVDDGFVHLDRVIALCKKYGIYTILDMHTAPGGVGKDPHSDCMTGHNYFWDHEVLQDVIIKIWGRIAQHYKDEPAVLGYDILNEPTKVLNFDVFNRFNNNTIREIRKFDANHVVFVEGLDWGKDFSMMTLDDTHQIAFSFHEYPSQVKELIYMDKDWNRAHLSEHLDMVLGTMDRYQLPKWCGETGIGIDNAGESAWPGSLATDLKPMLNDILSELNARRISWTTWTYKDNICMGLVRPKDDSAWARFTDEFGKKWDRLERKTKAIGPFEQVRDDVGGFDEALADDVWYIVQNMIRHIDVKKHLIPELQKIPFETLLQSLESFEFAHCVIADTIESAIKSHI